MDDSKISYNIQSTRLMNDSKIPYSYQNTRLMDASRSHIITKVMINELFEDPVQLSRLLILAIEWFADILQLTKHGNTRLMNDSKFRYKQYNIPQDRHTGSGLNNQFHGR